MKTTPVLTFLAAAFAASTTVEAAITYVDASTVTGGNTFLTSNPANTTWLSTANNTTANSTQWVVRSGVDNYGIGDNVLQSITNAGDFPQITTRISGLSDGTYQIWAFFWDQVDSATQNWGISTGLASGSLTTYSAPGEPAIVGATTVDVSNAADLSFTTPVKIEQAYSPTLLLFQQNLFGVNLGQITVSTGSAVDVFIDNNLVGTTNWRVWYDGVGYEPIPEPSTALLGGLAIPGLLRRRRRASV